MKGLEHCRRRRHDIIIVGWFDPWTWGCSKGVSMTGYIRNDYYCCHCRIVVLTTVEAEHVT